MGIAKNHPVFIWIKCQGMLFHDTLNRVKKDSDEYAKKKPNWSGITPATKTWAWNQLKELAKEDYYAGQIETRIEELDLKASNIKRQQEAQNQVWDEETNKLEMESERLKEIIFNAKKNLQLQ